jgi:hypothetical protein
VSQCVRAETDREMKECWFGEKRQEGQTDTRERGLEGEREESDETQGRRREIDGEMYRTVCRAYMCPPDVCMLQRRFNCSSRERRTVSPDKRDAATSGIGGLGHGRFSLIIPLKLDACDSVGKEISQIRTLQ